MSAIVKFDEAKLPAHLRNSAMQDNTDLTANVGGGFPVLSIKGKVFTVVRGGQREMLTREDADGDMVPASAIEVVLVKANKNFSKVYYDTGYKEGESDGKNPTCYSNNGDKPEADAEKPQSKTCAACQWNVWGSKVSDNGSKVKACTDVRRIAVVPAGQLNDPMLLRIPPATLKPLSEYGDKLGKRAVPYNAVLTKIKFDAEMATPKLTFAPVRFLTEEEYSEVTGLLSENIVEQIIGAVHTPFTTEAAQAAAAAPATQEQEEPPAAVSKPAEKKATTKATKTTKAAPAKAPEPEPTVVEGDDLDAELDALLDSIDD